MDNTDEELDIYNQIARVKQTIGPGQTTEESSSKERMARIGDGSIIAAGSVVRIICRENIALVVEPVDQATSQN